MNLNPFTSNDDSMYGFIIDRFDREISFDLEGRSANCERERPKTHADEHST
jgi:hypothetical protein